MTGVPLPIIANKLALLATCAATLLTIGCATGPIDSSRIPAPPVRLDGPEFDVAELADEDLENVRFQSPGGGQQPSQPPALLNSQSHRLKLDAPVVTVEDNIDRSQLISAVNFNGNRSLATHHLRRTISTREGRFYDPAQLHHDVQKLWKLPEVERVHGPYINQTPDGVEVTFDISERNSVSKIEFIGNRGIDDRTLSRESGLEEIAHLDVHRIRIAKTRIEELYRDRGYPRTQVEIQEGNEASHSNVIFLIHEDQKQRIWNVTFEGNTIATDGRLKHFIKAKPGIAKLFGGLARKKEIDQDVVRLESYYKSLGFFNVQIGREIEESNDGRWLTIRFIINEGPRYRVREVRFVGNQSWSGEQLSQLLQLKPVNGEMPEFNSARMSEDVRSLREIYGENGFVFADVQAEPRFLEEPGFLDMVYKIEEGEQYRVGTINIHYEGGNGITRHEVVRNRLSLRPGDLIDANKISNDEKRLGAARIFASGQEPGSVPPRIVVKPKDGSGNSISRTASRPRSPSRGSGSRPQGSGSRPQGSGSRY